MLAERLPPAGGREIVAAIGEGRMPGKEASSGSGQVRFEGSRGALFGLTLRGYMMMVPTIGLYRFWLVTRKRRLYWNNTIVDGDALEYTGSAVQLLIGFLFALGFFLPLYIAFFYLSTQSQEVAILGYAGVATLLWFLTGYAQYRARDFRLSRTLWRGIRFDQRGSAWGYALRRFLWSLLMVVTFGLVYPWMAASLWRYRYRHTWFGNRQFGISGTWRQLAGPFYLAYFGTISLVIGWLIYVAASGDYREIGELQNFPVPGTVSVIAAGAALTAITFLHRRYRARTLTRMLSSVTIGEARLSVAVSARTLFGQVSLYGFVLFGVFLTLAILAAVVAAVFFANQTMVQGSLDMTDLSRIFQNGWLGLLLIVVSYLAIFGTLGIVGEVILAYGLWRAVAEGTTIENIDSLRSVRAAGEDRSLAGEGLADALNVGAY